MKCLPLAALAASFLVSPSARAQTDLVPFGASWRYLDDGSDQNTAWRAADFADSSWSTGPAPLGYGESNFTFGTTVSYGTSSSNKHITTYFRHAFSVTDPLTIPALEPKIMRDDGGIVYLNGTEVFRTNMPAGDITYTTLTSTAIGEPYEDDLHTAAVASSLLVTGNNVLAVEIHQQAASSSDLRMDLRLQAVVPSISRGPYLQMGGTDRMTVRGRTNIPTGTVLRYGLTESVLDQTVANAAQATEHEVTVTGLSADTRYFYSVGDSTTTFASGTDYYFDTHPTVGSTGPTRIWVLGDSGTADASARAVRDAFETLNGGPHADLLLMLGDNAYQNGTDSEFQNAVFAMYPETIRNTVLWPTLGNHDAVSANTAQQSGVYYDIFSLPKAAEAGGVPSGTEVYYSFDYANVHFICLDSQGSNRSSTGPMAVWLTDDLEATAQEFIVAYWHHPAYTFGNHKSDTGAQETEMRSNLVPILEAYGVDLVLAGHNHNYERTMLIDGHYETSSNFSATHVVDGGDGDPAGDGAYQKAASPHQGAVYTVAGSSGKTGSAPTGHPMMVRSLLELGSVIIDVSGPVMHVRFIDDNAAELDAFTIEHTQPPNQPPTLVENTLSVIAGTSVTIDSSVLSATDPDGSAGALLFTVSDLSGGVFLVGGVQGLTFTQAQVSAGDVVFAASGATAPAYSIAVSDGLANTVPQAATIIFHETDSDIWSSDFEWLFGSDNAAFDTVYPIVFGTDTVSGQVFVTYTLTRRSDLSALSSGLVVSFSGDPDSGFASVPAQSSVDIGGGFQTDTFRDTVPVNDNGALTQRFGTIAVAGEVLETFATVPSVIAGDQDDLTATSTVTRFAAGVIGPKVAEGTATDVAAFSLTDSGAVFGHFLRAASTSR